MSAEATGFTDSAGHPLYFWVDKEDQPWVCCEYDHGPFCRRCIQVDDTLKSCLEAMVDGTMELVGSAPANQPPDLIFRLTPAGEAAANRIITESAEGFGLWAQLSGLDDPEPTP